MCAKERDWIQKNQGAIVKKANKLYRMITTEEANNLLRRCCVDFKKREGVLEKWAKKSNSPRTPKRKQLK
ncbi:MAG: type III toxin-antitoxin system ToxN/AbiQ family toxin [Lachnospiraceae bacterium]|nr:type III toxin-antitoxin system ToxN/AbiQ family toxin [Lachnospiraceae bacterium]